MSRKNEDYWQGYYGEIASRVGKALSRDNAQKQRIVARSPSVFYSMDADAYGQASAAELATRELKELGITPKNSDPVELLDAHHAGRALARAHGSDSNSMLFGGHGSAGTHEEIEDDSSGSMSAAEREEFFKGTKGGPEGAAGLLGVAEHPKRAPMDGHGSAHDSASGSFLDRYLKS